MLYFFELTDTFGGEANYSWVKRFKVEAKSINGAIRKVSADCGFQGRLRVESKDGLSRWNVEGSPLCIFGSEYDNEGEYYKLNEL
jgi:hypothetical protein